MSSFALFNEQKKLQKVRENKEENKRIREEHAEAQREKYRKEFTGKWGDISDDSDVDEPKLLPEEAGELSDSDEEHEEEVEEEENSTSRTGG